MSRLARLKRSLHGLQTAWSLFGVTLLLIVLLEAVLRGAFWIKDLRGLEPTPDRRVLAEGYDGATWPVTHYRELAAISDAWQPYVYFRQRPFRGETITIDAEGLRATWHPAASQGGTTGTRPPVKILMLGGSSLWGFGARDDDTIPSLIARGLHERGIRAEIRNLAEIGYVSTQETIALMRELQAGYRPDLVLFYDGVNDTTSALLEGKPTLSTNEINRVREFNLLQSPGRLAAALVGNLVKNSSTFRLAQSLGRRLGRGPAVAYPSPSGNDLNGLAEGVLKGYLGNIRIVEALGRQYGFRAMLVWQPVIFSKPRRVPFEEEEAEKYGWTRAIFEEVLRRVAENTELKADPAFHDLSGIFADSDALVFIDFCHTTEKGNARIAEVILSRLPELSGTARGASSSVH
jgi:lysophospholipase L1-like esterase